MEVFYYIMFFVMGSVLASFYCVVGTRLSEGKSLIKPGSHCIACNHLLKWYELVPIFSFLFLRGKCRYCQEKIPIHTFLCEIATGVLFVISYAVFGFSYSLWVALILTSLMILIFVSDFNYMIILDSPLVISGILMFILKLGYYDLEYALLGIRDGVIMFLFMLLIGFIGAKVFKREALGGGDIKLAFIMGLSLNLEYALMALVLSTFLALPYAVISLITKSNHEVPFGPFLIAATWIVFFYLEKFSYILQLFY